jgi:hypothetical protein
MNMPLLKPFPLALLLGLSAASIASAHAGRLCEENLCASKLAGADTNRSRLLDALQMQATRGPAAQRRAEMSDEEFYSFSGIGALICTVEGKQVTTTAFLVGAFDIGVTVAHPFTRGGEWVEPESCVYTSTDSAGQIRERIPVSYIKSQWQSEPGAIGELSKDFAVVRLSEPSRFAQRTMPLGKFSGSPAPVLMVGFKSDIDADTVKRKSRGTVYGRRAASFVRAYTVGFIHDMDSHGIAAGAPVIDERSGVIIGVHTVSTGSGIAPRNTMISMNEWLEQTLRFEMQSETTSKNH